MEVNNPLVRYIIALIKFINYIIIHSSIYVYIHTGQQAIEIISYIVYSLVIRYLYLTRYFDVKLKLN